MGRISDIETMGLVDGPGMRLVLFMSGCRLRCLYCHNPETWTAENSKEITPEEVLKKYQKYSNYYGDNGGVTFSGGEPLLQSEFVLETIKLLKENNIHTAIDTAGVADNYDEVLKLVDLVILDIKAVEKEEYEYLVSGKIEKQKEFLDKCVSFNKKLWIRQVIVPGINDDEKHIEKLKNFIKDIPNVERIELLPYHSMAKEKYQKLGIEYRLKETPDMDIEKCKNLQKLLKNN
ncbi:MAG: pyruvate formate lyase-activating protein [Clostridia bacterium]|nr:pyruvate formate lyase-activating protein [Clostridia bacterium]